MTTFPSYSHSNCVSQPWNNRKVGTFKRLHYYSQHSILRLPALLTLLDFRQVNQTEGGVFALVRSCDCLCTRWLYSRFQGNSLMGNRKCARCDTILTDEDVLKIQCEDGSWEVIPIPLCPQCFSHQLRSRITGDHRDTQNDSV